MLHLFTLVRDELHEVWFREGGALGGVEEEQRKEDWSELEWNLRNGWDIWRIL